jgi:uroporphyrinogen III methyltransferase/synthase
VDRLTAFGAEAIEAPLIRIVPPEDLAPLRRAASEAGGFDWIVFASANAVDAFMTVFLEEDRDIRSLKGPQLCAVGSSTAERLAHYGIKVDLVPDEFKAEAVVAALAGSGPVQGASVLLPRSDIGREVIAHELRKSGARVAEVVAYRTIDNDEQREGDPDVYGMLLEGRIDVVTFTSASAVRTFAKLYGSEQATDLLRHTTVATIGPITAEAVVQLGAVPAIQPKTYTIAALVNAIAAHYAATKVTKT